MNYLKFLFNTVLSSMHLPLHPLSLSLSYFCFIFFFPRSNL